MYKKTCVYLSGAKALTWAQRGRGAQGRGRRGGRRKQCPPSSWSSDQPPSLRQGRPPRAGRSQPSWAFYKKRRRSCDTFCWKRLRV